MPHHRYSSGPAVNMGHVVSPPCTRDAVGMHLMPTSPAQMGLGFGYPTSGPRPEDGL